MTALGRYIDDLVNNKEPQDDFPKNESSWEELYDLCGKLIAEIVTLRREAAQAKQALRIAELEEENENLKEIVGAVSCANTAKSPIP